MNLLFLSNLYPPMALGGYEQLCQEAAEGLVLRGHQVTILTSNYKLSPKESAASQVNGQVNGVAVIRSLYLEAPTDYYRPKDFFLKRKHEEQANLHEIERVVGETKPDLIMVWGMWNLSRNVAKAAETLRPQRTLYYLCSYWPSDDDAHSAYWQLPTNRKLAQIVKAPLKAFALRQLAVENYPPKLAMHHSACVSRYVRDTLVAAGKLPESATVISNGIDPSPFLASSERSFAAPLRLLYFGRLIADKGVHTALEAIGMLKARNQAQGLLLTILGGGHPDYEAELQNLVQKHDLSQQVEFVASVPRADIPAWLHKHDIFLFTSIWAEPMARSVMEAMAAGMLVIGSEVGGQKEMLIDGINSLTFAAGNANHLAAQIERARNHPKEMQAIAHTGNRLILDNFTLEQMVRKMENYLRQIDESVAPFE